jgi:hypothetical protein
VSTLDTITSYLRGKGLSAPQIAGVEGNLYVESGLSPTASNPREGAIGLAQWEGGRRTNLQRFARDHGGSETDLFTQLDFMWSELTGSEHSALTALMATNSAAAAATVWDQKYERSAGTTRQRRIDAANQIAGGHDPGAGGSSSSSSSSSSGVEVKGKLDTGSGLDLSLFSGWSNSLATIGLQIVAGAAAVALLVVGARQAFSDDKGDH